MLSNIDGRFNVFLILCAADRAGGGVSCFGGGSMSGWTWIAWDLMRAMMIKGVLLLI